MNRQGTDFSIILEGEDHQGVIVARIGPFQSDEAAAIFREEKLDPLQRLEEIQFTMRTV